MPPEVHKLLTDMADAADSIMNFARGRDIVDLAVDDLFRSAIYWKFAIIGEAMTQLRRVDHATADNITESTRIVAFRNQIIHGYSAIRDTVTWQIIKDKLPILRSELAALLR